MQTKVYKFGLLAPMQNEELVKTQMRNGHVYYNKLVELERKRRADVRAVLAKDSSVAEYQAAADGLVAIIEAQKKQPTHADKKEQKAYLKVVAGDLRVCRTMLKTAKKDSAEKFKPEIDAINEAFNASRRAERAASNTYWGTYLIKEASFDQAAKAPIDPSFRTWTGSGNVAVQIQKGRTWREVTGDGTSFVRVDMRPHFVGLGKLRPMLYLRIGSEGRDPIWACWPIILHREVPEDAKVLWAQVGNTKVAGRDVWHVCFTVQVLDPIPLSAPMGQVAMNFGWRRMRDGSVRVGYSFDDEDNRRVVHTHPRSLTGLEKADSIRGFRDKNLDKLKADLRLFATWAKDATEHRYKCLGLVEPLPFMIETIASAYTWKSPGRFVNLLREWKLNRFKDDDLGFMYLEGWAKRDHHLWCYEVGTRQRSLRRRLEHYRIFAAEMAETYSTLVIDNANFTDLRAEPGELSGKENMPGVRSLAHAAAPGELRQALVNAFRSRGGQVIKVTAVDNTGKCHACGDVQTFDRKKELVHKCTVCGVEWDQDENNCRNLLDRAKTVEAVAEGRTAKWNKRHTKVEAL